MQVPWTADRVRVVTEVYPGIPADVTDSYDDVIEFGYRSATGLAAILDWTRTLVCPWDPLPVGAGDYRVRYHVRDHCGEAVELRERPDPMAETLLQIWPASLGVPEEIKVTGALGDFWHPAGKLRRVWDIWP
ncbi:hypothetical protein [Amycolatopsis sp. lyj-90]|uniref:hypothetical protein n=1 Tax=Amycolatopsis sp. lyj-90 TaxID=2789285 RepID=UPI00397C81D7